jgi:hypothetical protein
MKRKMLSKVFLSFALLAFSGILISGTSAFANYFDKNLGTGQVRVFYKSPSPATTEAIVLGVGTAMSRDSYDNLANALTAYGYVVVIMDHQPGSMTKTDAGKFKNCTIEVQNNILGWLSGTGCTSIAHWILGGHSAGGQAAQNAVGGNLSLANAMFSIDPYNIDGASRIALPGLYWGFNVTTCFVEKTDAAEAAYYYNDSHRAFYRVNKIYSWGPCGYSPKFYHCSFADGSCPACTNCMYTPSYFYTDIAKSVNKFINAAFYGTWSKANVAVSTTTPTVLYVDNDAP